MAAEFQGQFQEAMREAEMADIKKSFDEVKEAATGFSGANVMTELQKDVTDALAIDKPVDAQVSSAIGEPVTPTEPAAPTPQTFVEAEAHRAANEPLAIARETQAAPQEAAPADAPKEAKAS
jgi:sec-independent protein translocase protein TatB